MGGGQDKLAWTAYPPTPVTKYMEQSDKENSWISLELCL